MTGILIAIAIFFLKIILWLFPLLGAILLGALAWKLWVHYIQQDFISGIDYVLLEIIPPREVLRSPKGMELFFTNGLYHWSEKGGLEAYWQGSVWFWHSLEIASIDGQVHFYVRTPTRLKDLVETQMYAQYPQAQVRVVEDYTLAVDKISEKSEYNLWGCEFKLEKPEAYPLKTYVDFELDKNPEEEEKIDPLSPVIELFGSIAKGEQMWLQIVVRPSKKEFYEHGSFFKKHDWVIESKNVLENLFEKYGRMNVIKGEERIQKVRPPFAMETVIKGISGKMTKIGFDTGIRACYLAKKEIFPVGSRTNNSRNIRLIFRQFSNPQLNSLVRYNSTQADAFVSGFFSSFFLVSPKKIIVLANRMLEEYRERAFFHLPLRHHLSRYIPWPLSPYIFPKYFHHHVFVLNIEELATLWHFPGQILKVPTLERIESKEASPPTNLPT